MHGIYSKTPKKAPRGKFHVGRVEPVAIEIHFNGQTVMLNNCRDTATIGDFEISLREIPGGGWYANAHTEKEIPAGLAGPVITYCDWTWRDA